MQTGSKLAAETAVTPAPHGFRQELAAMVRLSVPVVAVQCGLMLKGVIDVAMVGRLAQNRLLQWPRQCLLLCVALFGQGMLMALDPVVAQAIGAGDDVAIARGIQRGFVLAVLMSALASVLLLPAAPVLRALRQPAGVVPIAASYDVVSIAGIPPFYLFILLRQSLQAMRLMKPIVVSIIAANIANVALNWVLIFGHLGMPALGAVGSAWATAACRWLMAVLLAVWAWPHIRRYVLPVRADTLLAPALWRMLSLGAPIGVQFMLEYGIFGVVGLLMGWLGTEQMAGHQIALNLASFTFMVPLGVSGAAAVLVGGAIGRGDSAEAWRAAMAGLVCGAGFMALSGALLLTMPGLFAQAYTTDRTVAALAASLIPLAGVFQIFDGIQVVAVGILRGVADTRTPMLINVLGFWLIGMPVILWLGFGTTAGPRGLWWGLVLGLAVVAAALLLRVRTRLSGQLVRVVIDVHH